MYSAESQRRVDGLRSSNTGAVLCEYFEHQLSLVKTALISAPIEQVQRLQGKAAAYAELVNYFTKGRE